MPFMSRVFKEDQNGHTDLSYNFLNIQLIFILKKVLKSFPTIPYQMVCMLKHVGGAESLNNL